MATMAPSVGDGWSGGSSYFSTLGAISELPGAAAVDTGDGGLSDATSATSGMNWWDLFTSAVGLGLPGDPNLAALGPLGDAAASGVSGAATDVGNAVSSAVQAAPNAIKTAGVWIVGILILLAIIVVAWKV